MSWKGGMMEEEWSGVYYKRVDGVLYALESCFVEGGAPWSGILFLGGGAP